MAFDIYVVPRFVAGLHTQLLANISAECLDLGWIWIEHAGDRGITKVRVGECHAAGLGLGQA